MEAHACRGIGSVSYIQKGIFWALCCSSQICVCRYPSLLWNRPFPVRGGVSDKNCMVQQRRAVQQDSEDEDSALAQQLHAEYNGSRARPKRAAASAAKRRLASVRAGTVSDAYTALQIREASSPSPRGRGIGVCLLAYNKLLLSAQKINAFSSLHTGGGQ